MPWVRFDDQFTIHRKVDGLSDAAFRLHVSAIFWSARNLTDGCVPEEDLEIVSARVRKPARFATELVKRGVWHEAGFTCKSDHCPTPGSDGWVIHDYGQYQYSKEQVAAKRAKDAERQKRWRDSTKDRNGVSNASGNAGLTPTRPDPTSKEKPPTEVSSSANEIRDDVQRLCVHLADRIEGNGSKRPTIGKGWRDAARLLIDKDGRTEDQIHKAIDWCQNSEFWRANILSMPKLRQKYDQLRLAAKKPGNTVATRKPTTDQRMDQADAALAEVLAEYGSSS